MIAVWSRSREDGALSVTRRPATSALLILAFMPGNDQHDLLIARRSMQTERFIRTVLWISVGFNLVGAMAFLLPETVGQLSALPTPVPRLYSWLLASMVLLFGGMYAFLARQLAVNRSLLAIGAIAKAFVFLVFAACWALGDVPLLSVVGASGDLVLAGLFTWWLLGTR